MDFWTYWFNHNPLYLLFGGHSDEKALALTAVGGLVILTSVALAMKRSKLGIFLFLNALVAGYGYLALGDLYDALFDRNHIPSAYLADSAAVVLVMTLVMNIVGAFGGMHYLEEKKVDEPFPNGNPASLKLFRFQAYLLLGSVQLTLVTGLVQFFGYEWTDRLFLGANYPAWLACFVFTCTTVLTGLVHFGLVFKRRVASKRTRLAYGADNLSGIPRSGDIQLRGVSYDKAQLGNAENTGGVRGDLSAGFGDHPDNTPSGTITNLGIGHRTPSHVWDRNRRDYDQT